MDQDRLKHLFSKYLQNSISKRELAELLQKIKSTELHVLNAIIDEVTENKTDLLSSIAHDFDREGVYKKIQNQIQNKTSGRSSRLSKLKKWPAIAAAVLLFAGIGLFFMQKINYYSPLAMIEDSAEIHLPDQNRAIVTLEDGTVLNLLEAGSEVLEREGIQLLTLAGEEEGELTFRIKASKDAPKYQTFRSPKGISSTLILADGTKVWLNSDTEIRYPTSFLEDERSIHLKGEAYFDVQHDHNRPFIVSANGTDIKVLGTEFNVATNIEGEKTFTTLVSGAVEVYTANDKTKLKPGIQSIASVSGDKIETQSVNLREVTAWKEGYFRFNDDDVQTVLNKIKIWYDIQDIDIQKDTGDRFTGSVRRTRKLSDLLGQLERISQYKFKIIEGRVVVMK